MRCPDCSKMVSYGEPEAELQSEDVDDDGKVSATVRLVLPCGECGTELKDNEFEFEIETPHECIMENVKCGKCGLAMKDHSKNEGCVYEESEETGFDLNMEDPETTEDYRPKFNIVKGVQKAVPMRYQKHYFGVKVAGTITCHKCGEEVHFEEEMDEQSSSFNELT